MKWTRFSMINAWNVTHKSIWVNCHSAKISIRRHPYQLQLWSMHVIYCALLLKKYLDGLKHASNLHLRQGYIYRMSSAANQYEMKSVDIQTVSTRDAKSTLENVRKVKVSGIQIQFVIYKIGTQFPFYFTEQSSSYQKTTCMILYFH